MVSVWFLSGVVSIGFMISVAAVMSYFAYIGYHEATDGDGSSAGNASSLAD